jgi:hypothetical protein
MLTSMHMAILPTSNDQLDNRHLTATTKSKARHRCLTPVILATWEAEIGRITV